jgi:prepilin peptidase CpaA
MHEILLAACVVTGIAAVFDWRSGKIPNLLTVGVLIAAPIASAYVHRDDKPAVFFLASLLGAAICALVPGLLAFKQIVGMGDVKLLACIGALLGATIGIEAEFYAFAVAALVGPARLAYHGRLFRSLKDTLLVVVRPRGAVAGRRQLLEHLMTRFSMGPAIFVGTAVTAWLHWRAV